MAARTPFKLTDNKLHASVRRSNFSVFNTLRAGDADLRF